MIEPLPDHRWTPENVSDLLDDIAQRRPLAEEFIRRLLEIERLARAVDTSLSGVHTILALDRALADLEIWRASTGM